VGAVIDIDGLHLRAGSFELADVCLHVGPGEYFVLMGHTGSGKSLTIKAVCGLVRPAAGSIIIDGADVTELDPRDRQVGYMPQDCGLFPHMTVLKNITFSVRVRGLGGREAVEPLVELLGLGPLLDRRPKNLSGGERQKVALARALAGRPKVLLLDEPVSALDEPTRREVCAELLGIQRRLGISTIHVCHSLEEARSLADRAGVMHDGQLVQTGTVADLAANPATAAVARLMNVPFEKK